MSGFETPDDYTIVIKLLEPYPQLVHILSMGFTAPVAHEVIDKYGQDHLITNMVGTGPFILQQFISGSKLILKKNPKYRKEVFPSVPEGHELAYMANYTGKTLPFVDELHFHIFKESQPQWLNFLAGKIDISGVPKDNFDQAITVAL